MGLKFPDFCLMGEENPRKKYHRGNLSQSGFKPRPASWAAQTHPLLLPVEYSLLDFLNKVSSRIFDIQVFKRIVSRLLDYSVMHSVNFGPRLYQELFFVLDRLLAARIKTGPIRKRIPYTSRGVYHTHMFTYRTCILQGV